MLCYPEISRDHLVASSFVLKANINAPDTFVEISSRIELAWSKEDVAGPPSPDPAIWHTAHHWRNPNEDQAAADRFVRSRRGGHILKGALYTEENIAP